MKLITIILFSLIGISTLFGETREYKIEVIASTLYHEARGEGEDGLRAVASIIKNRSEQRQWKKCKGMVGVCLQKKQFSCHNKGYFKANPKKAADKKAYNLCKKIATEMVDGKFKSTVGKANHYCTNNCKVYWKKLLKNTKVIKNHTFGTL